MLGESLKGDCARHDPQTQHLDASPGRRLTHTFVTTDPQAVAVWEGLSVGEGPS